MNWLRNTQNRELRLSSLRVIFDIFVLVFFMATTLSHSHDPALWLWFKTLSPSFFASFPVNHLVSVHFLSALAPFLLPPPPPPLIFLPRFIEFLHNLYSANESQQAIILASLMCSCSGPEWWSDKLLPLYLCSLLRQAHFNRDWVKL